MDKQQDHRLIQIKKQWAMHGYTQREAASKLKITQSAICQYLNGHIPLNTDIVIKFAGLFNIPPPEIDPTLKF